MTTCLVEGLREAAQHTEGSQASASTSFDVTLAVLGRFPLGCSRVDGSLLSSGAEDGGDPVAEKGQGSADRISFAEEAELEVPIRWEGLEQVPFLYISQIYVHAEEDHFELTFGQALLPLEIGYSEETRERLVREGVGVRTIGRFAVTPAKMRDIVKVMTNVYASWEKRQQDAKSKTAPPSRAQQRRRPTR